MEIRIIELVTRPKINITSTEVCVNVRDPYAPRTQFESVKFITDCYSIATTRLDYKKQTGA